jgi:hypothetical protein
LVGRRAERSLAGIARYRAPVRAASNSGLRRSGGLVTTYPQSLQRHASTGWLGKPKRGRKDSASSAAKLLSPPVLQIGHHGVIRLTSCEFNLLVYAGSLEGTHRSHANVARRLGNANRAGPLGIALGRNCSQRGASNDAPTDAIGKGAQAMCRGGNRSGRRK